jgi:transmembrane sensor
MPSKHDLQIEDEALAWLIRVSSGEMTLQQEQSLTNWLDGNPAHRLAYAEAQVLWRGIGQLQEQPIVADNLAKMKAERESPANATVHATKPSAYAKYTFPLSQLMLMAACLAMVAVLCPTMTSTLQLWNADYQTAIGEQQTITLEDGSKLYLNAASALNLNYSRSAAAA